MVGNPWVDDKGDDFKKEVLISLEHLSIVQINEQDPVTPEDIQEAKTEKAAREQAAREKEEEERRAAEEAANKSQNEEDAE